MKLPIQYALFYPERKPLGGKRVNFFELGRMTFEKPDTDNFPGLRLAYEAAKVGGSMPTVYNAANELAVQYFLKEQISFLEIAELIESSMQEHRVIANPNVDEILFAEAQTYEYIKSRFN